MPPTYEHQGLIELFRNRPSLAAELLRDLLGVAVPNDSDARVESADATDLKPAERQADLVIQLRRGKPVLSVVVEVQLQPDPDKRRRWPAYSIGLWDRAGCPACVLVVTVDERTARWCREPIEIGPGHLMVPLVIGPDSVPVVEDLAMAERNLELAVLSAVAHGQGLHAESVGRAALLASRRRPGGPQVVYCDLIMAAVSDAARKALEKLMPNGEYEFQSDYFKNIIAKRRAEAEKQGRAEGEAKGRAEGEARGRAEGEARGRAEGRAEGLLTLLQARGLRVSDEGRARILACTDVAQLDAWIRAGVTVASVDELFRPQIG